MGNSLIPTNIDEYLRKRLMPVEGAIPQLPGIEMFGNSVPAGAVGGDLSSSSATSRGLHASVASTI